MLSKMIHWFFFALQVMFFTGLAGCVLVVIISWITILKEGFSKDA